MAAVDLPEAPIPPRPSLKNLNEAVRECRACDLWEGATQAVMGEGARHAHLMLVGEQPDRWQVTACFPWLEAEIKVVQPAALVCLGATAGQQLLGSHIRIGRDRG